GVLGIQAPQFGHIHGSPQMPDQTGHQEEIRFHHDIMDQVKNSSNERDLGEQGQPPNHKSQMADDQIGKDPPDIVFDNGSERTGQDGHHGNSHQYRFNKIVGHKNQ